MLYLALSIVLFSLLSPLLKLLIEHGKEVGLRHPDAIRFCNVLFVGNLCAGLVPLIFKSPKKVVLEFWHLPVKVKTLFIYSIFLTFLYPSLIFFSLELTTVINLTLISQVEGVFFIIAAMIFLKERINVVEGIGYGFIVLGIFILLLLTSHGHLRPGDLLVIGASFSSTLQDITNKKISAHCSLPTIIVISNMMSSLIFFAIAYLSFGFMHFAGVTYGELWIIMLAYAGIGIVVASLLWLYALKHASVTMVANLSLAQPILTILFAYFLLKEVPVPIDFVALTVIFIGLFITAFGKKRSRKLSTTSVRI